MDLSLSIV